MNYAIPFSYTNLGTFVELRLRVQDNLNFLENNRDKLLKRLRLMDDEDDKEVEDEEDQDDHDHES